MEMNVDGLTPIGFSSCQINRLIASSLASPISMKTTVAYNNIYYVFITEHNSQIKFKPPITTT